MFPESHHKLADRLYEELAVGVGTGSGSEQVVPFVDVIDHGAQKQIAIGLMSRQFQPSFAPALRAALNDPDNSIRIQAATAITNIENRFQTRSESLEDRGGSAGGTAGPKSQQYLLELAQHYDQYAFTGLLDPDRERRNREQALAAYRSYLEATPDDLGASVAVGRLLMRNGQVNEAVEWLGAARSRLGASLRIDTWYMEGLYALRRYREVRVLAASLDTNNPYLPGAFKNMVSLWRPAADAGPDESREGANAP